MKPKVHINCMVQNEGILLDHVLPIWKSYPVDRFVFYNDNSTDNTLDVISKHIGDRATIVNLMLAEFNEARHRNGMMECSKKHGADIIISLDADELLSSSIIVDWDEVMERVLHENLWFYWYNVVKSLKWHRYDPAYERNFRNLIFSVAAAESLHPGGARYHSPRIPKINLPSKETEIYGIIHLQAINERFYALKQLWYKHFEYREYKYSIECINGRYDPIVNNLNFREVPVPSEIVEGLEFDSAIYNEIEKVKKYKEYIINNLEMRLVTFGIQYLGIVKERPRWNFKKMPETGEGE